MKSLMKMKHPMKTKNAKIRICQKKILKLKLRKWKHRKHIRNLKSITEKNLQKRIVRVLKVNKTQSRRSLNEWRH